MNTQDNMSQLFPVPYVVYPDESCQVIYASVRDGNPDITERLTAEGFESVLEIPGWGDNTGWSHFVRRLFPVEAE